MAKGTPVGTPVAGGTRWGSGATRVRGPRHYCVPLGPTYYLLITVYLSELLITVYLSELLITYLLLCTSRTYLLPCTSQAHFHVTPCNSHRCTRRPRAPTRTRPTPTAVARTTTAAGWACTTRRITYCSVRFVPNSTYLLACLLAGFTYCSVRFVPGPPLLPMRAAVRPNRAVRPNPHSVTLRNDDLDAISVPPLWIRVRLLWARRVRIRRRRWRRWRWGRRGGGWDQRRFVRD